MRNRRRVCAKGHEFVTRDRIAPGLTRRVCRWCPTVSLFVTAEEVSKPRWAPPWEAAADHVRPDPWPAPGAA